MENKKYKNNGKNGKKSYNNNNYHSNNYKTKNSYHKSNKDTKKITKPEFNGFKNRIRLKRVEPSGPAIITQAALENLYDFYMNQPLFDHINFSNDCNPVHEDIINFRKNLFDNYHLYKILVSNENHFIPGYSYRMVGWVSCSREYKDDAANIHIWLDRTIVGNEEDKLYNIIFFKTVSLISELFLKLGRPVRVMIPTDIYEKQKRYLNKSWVVDKSQNFNSIFGNTIYADEVGYTVIRNNVCTIPIKIGGSLDSLLIDNIMSKHAKVTSTKPIFSKGINLFCKGSSLIPGSSQLMAQIDKCDKNNEIHYRCLSEDQPEVENIIKESLEFESAIQKRSVDISKIEIIYDGEIKEILHNADNKSLEESANKVPNNTSDDSE